MSDIIEAGGVIVRPPWKSFEDAVRGLVDSLTAHGGIPDAVEDNAARAVCEREEMGSTAIVEISVHIPHARLTGIRGVVAALAVSPTSVYSATGTPPISIMALVLSAPDLAAEHLSFLSRLSMLLQSETLRSKLSGATDSRAVLEILRQQEVG